VSIGVPRGVVFVAALVVVVIPVSHYAYTRFRDTSDKHINTSGRSEHPESSTDPQVLLSEANRLYWLNSGQKLHTCPRGPKFVGVFLLAAIRSGLPADAWATVSLPRNRNGRLSIEVLAQGGTLPR